MSELPVILEANERYAVGLTKGELPPSPARRLAVLTCMDARLDPAKALGLAAGDAHVIRNAGGRASDDAIRSLVISQQLLGTREVLVIHHTDCGMLTVTNKQLRDRLRPPREMLRWTGGPAPEAVPSGLRAHLPSFARPGDRVRLGP